MVAVELIERAQLGAVNFLVEDWFHGLIRSNTQFLNQLQKLNILLLEVVVPKFYGCGIS